MTYRHIIDYSTSGKSNAWIASYYHISRNTVASILKEYHALLETGDKKELRLFLNHPLGRCKSDKISCPKIDEEAKQLILSLLAQKRGVQHGKQHITYKMICNRVHDAGYTCSESTIRRFIAYTETAKQKPSKNSDAKHETQIRIEHIPGIECQFDWGEISLAIKGQRRRKYYIAVFTFPYSMGRYAYIFTHQDKLAFMESHRNFFHDVGGVPQIMTYDNMKVAVAKFVSFNKRKITDSLRNLMAFYKFGYRFCNIRAGNEKGSVEESVDFIRNEAFGESSEFDSVADAQKHLTETCQRLNQTETSAATVDKQSRLEEELSKLHKVKGEIACFERSEYDVDKYSCVLVERVHYSVPEAFTMKRVTVEKYSERLEFYAASDDSKNYQLIAIHERRYNSGKRVLWQMDPYHYLDTFEQKPESFQRSVAFRSFPVRLQKFINGYSERYSTKEVIAFIRYAHDCGFVYHDVLDLLALCHKNGLRRPSLTTLKSVLSELKNTKDGKPSNIDQLFSRLLAAQNLDNRSRSAVKSFLESKTSKK